MGCSASVPAPAPAAEPEADAPVVPGAHVPQRMSMSELGRQLTSSSMGMHLSRNSAPAATKRRSSLFRRQSKEELPPAVRINPLTDLFDEFTPMVGMLFDDFKKCGHIPRSDEARREGWLTEFDPEVHQAVFVSQNWWHRPKRGRASPDFPEGHEQSSLKWVDARRNVAQQSRKQQKVDQRGRDRPGAQGDGGGVEAPHHLGGGACALQPVSTTW